MTRKDNRARNTIMTKRFLLCLGLTVLAACSPTQATRGNLVDPDDLSQIKVGVSNKDSVRNILGSPTTTAPMNDDVWYYIGQKTERFGWRREKVTERRTLTMVFNQEGVLESLTPEENQGREVAMVKDITPTQGNEMTVLQQFFGNLGRFNNDNRDVGMGGADPGAINN